jgi:DNA-binding response OmpR family regulator
MSRKVKKDLLCVEKDTRGSFTSRLSTEGYGVCLAVTGNEALEALGRHKITHAIILNAISLRTNGVRTCASLKRVAPDVFGPKGFSHLSAKEIQILKYLIKKNGSLVPKEELFTKIWETSYVGDMNTLYTHINFLRNAIEQDSSSPHYLLTVRGKGYLLKEG